MFAISPAPIVDFLRTAALLAVVLYFYGDLRHHLGTRSRWQREFYSAVFFAFFTLLSMQTSALSVAGTLINFRGEAILLATVFGGPLPGLVAVATGILVRAVSPPGNTMLGIAILLVAYAIGALYHLWVNRRGRRLDYLDLVALGGAFDLGRVAAWLLLLGYCGTLDIVDRTWVEILVVFPVTVFVLGATVLVAGERRALTRTVADNEARIRNVLDQLPISLTLVDNKDRFTFVNRTQANWMGVPVDEQIGQTRQEIWDRAGAGLFPNDYTQRALAGEAVQSLPQSLMLHGARRYLIGTFFPVRDAKGKIKEIGTVGVDISELWSTREELSRRDEMLQRLNNALAETVRVSEMGTQPLDVALRRVTETAGAALCVRRTGVFRFDLDADEVERLDLWDAETKEHLPLAVNSRPPLWQETGLLDGDDVLTIEDTSTDDRAKALLDYMRVLDIGAMMAAPVNVAGRFRGIVTFSHVGGTRSWTIEEQSFARSIADVLAIVYLNDRYREALAALDLIEDGIYIEEANGRVIYANRVAFAMARGKPAAATNQLVLKTLPAIFPRPPHVLQSDADRYETTIDLGEGHRDIQIARRRLPNGGVIALVRDMTRRNRAQRERQRLEHQLVQASKLEAIGQLAGGIAHDFNNLLGAILGFARFIEEDLPRESAQHQYANRIISACERGKAIVMQINSFARARNVERSNADLAPLIVESRDLLGGLIRSTTALSMDVETQDLKALANRGQITQLLVNLVANANDALEAQPGTIAIKVSRIPHGETAENEDRQLSLFDGKYQRRRMIGQIDPARDYARIDVSDTGKGISPRIVPHIFEPFFTSKRRAGGTGLGLSVVQSIVTTHDGVLYLDSVEGKGTTFSIYLPLIDEADAEPDARSIAAKNEGTERVLIVDDDIDVADMLSIGLARVGYEVAVSNDPLEALEAFTEEPHGWDIAIIDRMMPEIGGVELAKRLKSIRSDLRIILCTGLDDGIIDPAEDGQGFDLFFIKPISPGQIAGAIRQLLDEGL